MPDIWGNISEDEQYKYKEVGYTPYKAYNESPAYSGYEGFDGLEGYAKEMLSGKLTDAENSFLQKQLEGGIAKIRAGGYGMPVGAQMGLQAGLVKDTALQGLLSAQARRAQALPALQFMAGEKYRGYESGINEKRFGYTAGQDENRYGQIYGQNERQFGANIDYKNTQERNASGFNLGKVLNPVLSAGTTFGLNKLFPVGTSEEKTGRELLQKRAGA